MFQLLLLDIGNLCVVHFFLRDLTLLTEYQHDMNPVSSEAISQVGLNVISVRAIAGLVSRDQWTGARRPTETRTNHSPEIARTYQEGLTPLVNL